MVYRAEEESEYNLESGVFKMCIRDRKRTEFRFTRFP